MVTLADSVPLLRRCSRFNDIDKHTVSNAFTRGRSPSRPGRGLVHTRQMLRGGAHLLREWPIPLCGLCFDAYSIRWPDSSDRLTIERDRFDLPRREPKR
ncbi:hypothetical protein LSAT2_015029 [Lamellibrachia satsuma]|nr:hypothetical protein LSAT2_015029 [Lamellibrachia satsuma]